VNQRERASRALVLNVLGRINVGRLTITDDTGTSVCGPGNGPEATVVINSPRAWPMFLHGGRGVVDAYVDGLWETPDMTDVFRVAARNIGRADAFREKFSFIRTPWLRARDGFARNTRQRSRRDIAAHYHLGNDMFSLWLDPRMMYSSAIFDTPESSLEDAAERKLEMICEKLELTARDHVVEIGTGWGGFAVYAATTRGCRVTTTTISKEQHDVAVKAVNDAGVDHLVDVRLDDYRDLTGTYDKLVSIEMIEAVGWKDFPTFFKTCNALLKPDGLMLLQAITIDDRAYEISKITKSFIRTYIFPNGNLPSLQVMSNDIAKHTDMRTLRVDDYAWHYAETLRRWHTNFNAARDELEALGYDERFRRLWRCYLSYCEAGFEERHVGLAQLVLAKPLYRGPYATTTQATPGKGSLRARS
jgi:cyclopropane-fatty-acyl-phospholipid synthase